MNKSIVSASTTALGARYVWMSVAHAGRSQLVIMDFPLDRGKLAFFRQ